MIERWFLFGTFIFFPAMGLVLFLALLALVRYWAEYNAESTRMLAQLKAEIEARKAARREKAAGPEHPAMEAMKVEASAEAKQTRTREREYEARKQAMEKLDTRALATLVRTMMVQDEGFAKATAKK